MNPNFLQALLKKVEKKDIKQEKGVKMEKLLKYSLTEPEVNTLLNVLNGAQIRGIQNAQVLIALVKKLQTPDNRDELDKEVFEQLKTKFEKKEEKNK